MISLITQWDRKRLVAMNLFTGEALLWSISPAMTTDFIYGMEEKMAANEDERKLMLNCFAALSSRFFLKPITEVGLNTGALSPDENLETQAGLRWQKDAGWGGYYVTTLHGCSPVNLENAYIYSGYLFRQGRAEDWPEILWPDLIVWVQPEDTI